MKALRYRGTHGILSLRSELKGSSYALSRPKTVYFICEINSRRQDQPKNHRTYRAVSVKVVEDATTGGEFCSRSVDAGVNSETRSHPLARSACESLSGRARVFHKTRPYLKVVFFKKQTHKTRDRKIGRNTSVRRVNLR